MVTIKLQVQDPNGYFLPNIRRENFAVYEDGVRQKNVDVDVEHAAVSLALLVEAGGRYHELNKLLGFEIPAITRHALEVLGRDDKIAVFKYAGELENLADFNQGREVLQSASDHFNAPPVSETNFYDALLETLNRMRDLSDRKAVIVVSSREDTFSKATYQQVLEAARTSGTPIYVIGLCGVDETRSRYLWTDCSVHTHRLGHGRKAVGDECQGFWRPRLHDSVRCDLPAVYDDIMENLRIRYVITYVSSNPSSAGPPRSIRVDLIDPKTGEALKIRDASGKPVAAKVYLQETFTPKSASG
jgi:hypothetical protein